MDGWTPDASFFPDEKEENKRSNVINLNRTPFLILSFFFLNMNWVKHKNGLFIVDGNDTI